MKTRAGRDIDTNQFSPRHRLGYREFQSTFYDRIFILLFRTTEERWSRNE